MTRPALVLLLAAACSDPAQGIAVGNPGSATARVVPGDGIATLEGTLDVERIVLEPCEPGPTAYLFGDALDLGAPDPVRLEPGTWCSLTVAARSLVLQGELDDGRPYHVALVLSPVRVDARDGGIEVDPQDGDAFVLQLGPSGWLSAGRLAEAGDADVGPKDDIHDALAEAVARASLLRVDDDRDGEVQQDEPVVARGSEAD